ncbi:MAG TPA: hypothetical protein VGL88_11550 [Pseudonocardiaceae bacterium]|jgi:hypothetical protein
MHLASYSKNSPTLFATDRDSYVVQGWIVTDPQILAMIAVSDDETIVEVLAALLAHLAKDELSGDVVKLVPPIVHIAANGNYIIKGRRVTDPEALGQMTIPDHETCIEVSRSAVAALVGA